jgi:dipeptidyl-peptidase 4
MRITSASALAILLLAGLAYAQPPDMLARYQAAEAAGSPEHGRLVYKARVEPRWIGAGDRFWYRNDVRGTKEFILVDPAEGTRGPVFDHARLAEALSAKLGRTIDATRLPFQEIGFSEDGASLSFRTGTRQWVLALADYTLDEAPASATQPPAEPPKADSLAVEQQPSEPGLSPDGKWVAFVKESNVWVRSKSTGEESALTTNGAPGNAYGAFFWSPDSRRLVAYRTEPGDHLKMPLIHIVPEQGVRPTVEMQEYELPGDKLDKHEMWLVDVETRQSLRAETDPVDWGGPPEPRWAADGRTFTIVQEYRGYQRVLLAEVDAGTGKVRPIIDERSETFISPMNRFLEYLDDTGEILWASERDGWNHLYLYDARTGAVKRQVTSGEWTVREVVSVDREHRTVLLRAGGREPGQSPYNLHWYRVGLDDGTLVRLTEGDGTHDVRFTPSGEYLLATYSRVDLPPVTELRRAADGSLVTVLERADAADLLATGWTMPEPFHAKGRDGKTDIWGVIYRPSHLDPAARYPVLELIYAGPQDPQVPVRFSPTVPEYTELGLIVVQLDGMGMPGRSKAFHDVCWHNLGDSGFPDRILWMQAAAERYPYIDTTRVGITGHSAGGYNAARALLAFGDFYKVGIACAGNHDHRTDKVWWNELWMGYPVGPWYEEQSNVTNAGNLTGKLMLIHGALDHNVNAYGATMQLADALIRANKDFDLIILPRDDHGFSGTYAKRRMWDYFTVNLLGATPPKEYAFGGGQDAGASCTITVRNTLSVPVEVCWLSFDGSLTKYHDLAPGAEVQQHTYVGHQWEAQVDGVTVSSYTASLKEPVWEVKE